ncbi:hypothetical protein A2841_04115 [Candidatus Kaiserbacteria bacterium RIFCSPHIGHO2_01_FULL_48_10]|uniref:TraC-like domain-containing protein n=1 Tax=Candidatus Kaiserbacteria bacterium RIFCSPHIGHO2_01_FULL_48_10 TaxID=1798476 RepID=A0A1F6C594_9BACT|nr:MAG: hypothetical protein A2841_04115 [Candidatus Kaiserbacteria bacterium RIFCSPHIGHO2_01_FULL_48_10]
MAQTQAQTNTTQEFVPIREVRDGVVVLKDGGLRMILMTSSLNFALKSQDEQAAILAQFQNFLNSLEFSIQIFVQSRELDIRPYIALLEERHRAQTSDLMKIQVREYIDFVRAFTEEANIMSKSFFIIVPYTPPLLSVKKSGISDLVPFGRASKRSAADASAAFEEHRTQLEQRVSIVEQGLIRCGIRSVVLGTEEVIELYYKIFNPGELERPLSLSQQQ